MQRIKRTAVIAGLVVGLGATGVAGVAQAAPGNGLGSPGARISTETSSPAQRTARHAERLKADLAPLVADGTITQAQADAVASTLAAKGPRGGRGDDRGEGRREGRGEARREGVAAAATALGMTPDELRTELRNGTTIAQIAAAKDVDVQTVIDAMVNVAKTRVDAAVADGKITQAEADAELAEITQRITDRVNNGRPAR